MAIVDEISVQCSRCGGRAAKPVDWIQENVSFRCDHCGGMVPLDKDAIAKQLARLETEGRVR